MSDALRAFEDALANLIAERTGEPWPVAGYICYAATLDPEAMVYEEAFWVTPAGQHTAMTRGLLEQAKDELTADAIAAVSYIPIDDDDDD